MVTSVKNICTLKSTLEALWKNTLYDILKYYIYGVWIVNKAEKEREMFCFALKFYGCQCWSKYYFIHTRQFGCIYLMAL